MAEVRGDLAVKRKMDVIDNARFNKGMQSPYLEMIDDKTGLIPGGTFTSANWRTRDLTSTVVNDFATTINLAAVAGAGANFTLPAGIYYIEASAPAMGVDEHIARLADTTSFTNFSAPTVVLGTAEFSPKTSGWTGVAGTGPSMAQTRSVIAGRFTLTSSTRLEIQHICKTSSAGTDGMGSDAGFYLSDNVYTTVRVWQVRADS
jgi:hypothetical protein